MMSEMKHTPGPWEWAHSDRHPGRGSISEIVSQETGSLVVSLVNDRGESYSDDATYAANARLIAAAPELLEACGMVEEWLASKDDPTEADKIALSVVRAAIAKAEGRAG